jgi:hypothetical protein
VSPSVDYLDAAIERYLDEHNVDPKKLSLGPPAQRRSSRRSNEVALSSAKCPVNDKTLRWCPAPLISW